LLDFRVLLIWLLVSVEFRRECVELFIVTNSSTGQTIIADIFDQRRRGTAVGFFMVGSVLGPALGPLVGGIIVSFTTWRVIFWVQTGMVGMGLLLSFFFVPSIAQPHQAIEKPSLKLWGKSQVEMLKVFTLLIYPNVFFAVCVLLIHALVPAAMTDI
jgi:MFS family permease